MRSLNVMLRSLILVLTMVLYLAPAVSHAQSKKLNTELLVEAETFRFFAASDFMNALKMSSTPEANLKFAELGELLWSGDANADNWSIFFRHSLINFVAGNYEVETIVFQHPWADISLLTGWSRSPKDKRMRIVDISIVMNSVARGAKVPFPVGRGWMNEKSYAPNAVGIMNAATTKAIADFESGKTKHPLEKLSEEEVWGMIAGVGLQWMEQQADRLPLLIDEPGISRMMRLAWNEVMAAAQQGRLAEVLPANAVIEAFEGINPLFWGTLEPVAYVETDDGAVSLHASWRNPNIYAALAIRGDETRAEITHFDLYQFSDFIKKDAK